MIPLLRKSKRFVLFFFLINVLTFLSLDAEEVFDLTSILDYIIICNILVILLYYIYNNFSGINYKNRIDRLLGGIFVLYSFILVISAVKFELFFIQLSLKGIYYLLPYFLAPLLLMVYVREKLILQGISLTRKLLPLSFLILVYIFLNLDVKSADAHYYLLNAFIGWMPLAFLVQDRKYKSSNFFISFLLLLSLILSAVYGRRTWFLIVTLYFLALIILNWSETRSIARKIFFLVLTFMVGSFGMLFTSNVNKPYILERGLSIEAFEHSRGNLFDDFHEDFNSNGGWVFGRGLNGTVKRSIAKNEEKVGSSIENGFYVMILKGGLFYLGLFMLLMIRAIYKLIYIKKTRLSRSMGLILVIYIIGMIGFNIPIFHISYLSLYVFVGYALRR